MKPPKKASSSRVRSLMCGPRSILKARRRACQPERKAPRVAPVSYTHLDVYKRQGQALTGGSMLNVGSLVFMLAVFAGAYGLAYFVRKEWL